MVDSNNETIKKKKIVVKKKGMTDDSVDNSIVDTDIDELNKPKSRVRKKENVSKMIESTSMMDSIKEEIEEEKVIEETIPKKSNVDLSTRLKNFRNNRKKKNVEIEPEPIVRHEEKEKTKTRKETKIEKESPKVNIEVKKEEETKKQKSKNKEKKEKSISNNIKNSKNKNKDINSNKKEITTDKKIDNNLKEKNKKKEKLPDILFSGNAKTTTTTNKDSEKKKKDTSDKKTNKSNKTSEKKTIKAQRIKVEDTIAENRPKRVLKPQVSKVFTIISDILYWIVFIFIVVLLFIVCVQRFSNNELSIGGIRIYNVSTESMLSKYSVGDIILAKDVDPSTLKIGDDIAYNGKADQLEGKIITHEIQSISKNDDGSYTIITKGVQNDIEDPAINSDQIKGKIIKKLLILSAISKVASNNFGLFFAIFIPVAVIIFINMIRIMNATDEQ